MILPSIYFHSEEIKFILPNKKKIRQWIIKVSQKEGRKVGAINVIFTSDDYLYQLNVKYIDHKHFTDIITFDYNEGDIINGDIFISIDRIKDNAMLLRISFKDEIHRVIIHGILHLVGYKDKLKDQKLNMRAKEDYCLSLLPEIMTQS